MLVCMVLDPGFLLRALGMWLFGGFGSCPRFH